MKEENMTDLEKIEAAAKQLGHKVSWPATGSCLIDGDIEIKMNKVDDLIRYNESVEDFRYALIELLGEW